jgi:vacuolar-type H+-ATPase subunit B/Vma2
MKKEYLKLDKVEGALIELSDVHEIKYGEVVEVENNLGEKILGKVIKVDKNKAVVQIFGTTLGISINNTKVSFKGKPFEIPLSKDILGRVFNGVGMPIDGGGDIYSDRFYNVNGRPINPVSREYPRDYIQTGISAIDALTTLIRGQKLPIFSGAGLPHNELAAQIVRQAKIKSRGEESDNFSIVFAAIGVKRDEAFYFTEPNDDITHPIPDLTGYITEGQIVLSRDLYQKGIYPPIDVLPSLSRLMKDGIGEGYTREDHPDVANQLFSAYSKVQNIRALAQIVGEDDLSDKDKKYLEFGNAFEERFLSKFFARRLHLL